MSVDSVTTDDVQRALREMSRLLVGTCDDLAQATARAESAEAEIDELVYVLTEFIVAVETKSKAQIAVAAAAAKCAMLGARAERGPAERSTESTA